MKNTITKEMILSGISAGVVKLIDSPHDSEPACQIGDHWFYYAGSEGNGVTSAEYIAKVPLDEIANEIVGALEGIRDDLDGTDEYGYYEAILREAGITEAGRGPARTYEAELHYGYQRSLIDYETYHAFVLTDPDAAPNYETVEKRLSEILYTSPEDDNFGYNCMNIKIPDSIVHRIQNDVLNEIMASRGGDKEKAYELFKLWWMLKHHYTLSDLVRELTDLQYEDPEDSDRISTPISDIFREWEADTGFGGEIWPCFDEFMDAEYHEAVKEED